MISIQILTHSAGMSDGKPAEYSFPLWCPGAIRKTIISSAEKIAEYDIVRPPLPFYKALADRAEEIANEAIAEAINARDDHTVIANIKIARRLLDGIGDDMFLATEAEDVTLARLAAYLLLEGHDGYNHVIYCAAWGAHRDPEWGTIWSIHQDIRDFTPAFLFKVCMRGDVRFLGVECHAPNRRLPSDLHDRTRARTMIMSGIPVIAFSPTEVAADAAECVAEVSNALAVLAQELLALKGAEPPPRRDFRPKVLD
jgi:hypothetical protein